MTEVRDFLESYERLRDKTTCHNEDDGVKYIIWTIGENGMENDDDVILEIDHKTEPCVLIGGNELEISTLSGLGRLSIIDLATGDKSEVALEPGVSVEIPSHNTIYWYENLGTESLFVRDHSDDFDFDNEPTLKNVVDTLISLS